MKLFQCISVEPIFYFPPVLGKYSGQLNIGKLLHHYFVSLTVVLVVLTAFLPAASIALAVTHNETSTVTWSNFYLFSTFVSVSVGFGTLPCLLISEFSPH